MIDALTGPQDIFTIAAGEIVRDVKTLRILSEAGATFSTLVFKFPSGQAGAVGPAGITFSSNIDLHHVKSFTVASGAVLAIFYGAPN